MILIKINTINIHLKLNYNFQFWMSQKAEQNTKHYMNLYATYTKRSSQYQKIKKKELQKRTDTIFH